MLGVGLVVDITSLLGKSKRLIQAVFLGKITLSIKDNYLIFCKI